jgi:peptidyl-prolyl cis-trans isomerase A (cyclophilin A)
MRLTAITFIIVALFVAIGNGSAGGQANREKLLKPAELNDKAPDKFQVKFDTSKGEFIVEVTRAWAPTGADRFYNLVKYGYYDGCRFFRVIENFMAQFGINGDPKVNAAWNRAVIKDDPVKQSNTSGFITFAMGGPDTRTTQVFINTKDNSRLDRDGFSPFGKVIKGMAIVEGLYNNYGDGPPKTGPDQGRLQAEGNAYLEKSYPKLDYVKSAVIIANPEK